MQARNKPQYRVKTMAEIRAEPRNGYTVATTFAGGGGSSTGYEMAGYSVIWANEFVEAARATYRANHPDTHLDPRDIRDVQAADILKACNIKAGELDIFDGSPPCNSFSTAGKVQKKWGQVSEYYGKKQVCDDLFFDYARILRDLQPKVFIAENVSGLTRGVCKGYFLRILQELKSCGYKVEARLLAAHRLGVPQMRVRVIFIGVRQDLAAAPVFPKPLPYVYTIRDAIEGLRDDVEPQAWLSGKSQAAWHETTPGKHHKKYHTRWKSVYNEPAHTLCAAGGVWHPVQPREFSIAEMKRLNSVPDDYILHGSYRERYERCGLCVPPVMMMHIAAAVRDGILDKLK